jgi:serine protease AprX
MATQPRLTSHPIARAMFAAMACASLATPALAQHGHRARLSADLADHLSVGSASVEVIIDGDHATVDRLASRYNLVVKRYLRSGGVVRVNAGQLSALQSDLELDHLSGDIKYRSQAVVDPIDEGIGADQVWAGAGDLAPLSGKGVTVAVIDSGFDFRHNALKGRTLYTVDFTGGDGTDHFGHGTHVAAIIAGQQGKLADTRMYRGVASGASLINLRVLNDSGEGTASDVIEAIDWAIDHRAAYNIRIINLSLGAPVLQPYRDDPVCAAVERAVRAGILVVTAAGNQGQTEDGRAVLGGINSPANSPYAIVGALDTNGTADRSDDTVATFSSHGPTLFDLVIKPDIVAPGRRITSAEAAGSLLSVNFPQQHVAGSGANAYIKGSGTSMAAAFVSGAAALLIEERPTLKPLGVKVALEMSASLMPDFGFVRTGTGSLNVLAAAEFVRDGNLDDTTIAGQEANASQIALAPGAHLVSAQSIAGNAAHAPNTHYRNAAIRAKANQVHRKVAKVKGSSDALVWGASDALVWGASGALVWGASEALVWGASDALVWGAADALVWGASDALVWGAADALVWGASDALVWGASDALVWGAADALVWGASDALVWGAADALVWGASDALVWGASDALVWGASDALVWGA